MVDVFNALDGDGAYFSRESGGGSQRRSGENVLFGKYTEKEVYQKIVGKGRLQCLPWNQRYAGSHKDANEGNEKAAEAKQAFLLQVAKDIGSMACVLNGKVDQIIVTGGIAYGQDVVDALRERAEWIAPFTVYPGEDELLALAQGALRVLNGEEQAKDY